MRVAVYQGKKLFYIVGFNKKKGYLKSFGFFFFFFGVFWIDKVEEGKLIRIIKFLFLSYFKKIEKKLLFLSKKLVKEEIW